VGGGFNCYRNQLTNFDGLPEFLSFYFRIDPIPFQDHKLLFVSIQKRRYVIYQHLLRLIVIH